MMGCYDDCCSPEDEGGPEVVLLSRTDPRARKEYTCHDCNGTIRVGTVYHRVVALVDGFLHTSKTHDRYGVCADFVYEYDNDERIREEESQVAG